MSTLMNVTRWARWPVLLAIGLAAGCANVDLTKTSRGFVSPTDPNGVDILKTRPALPYEELGTVTVTGFAADDSARMHNAIRSKSSSLGADAVLLTEEGVYRDGFWLRRWATGVAIRYGGPRQHLAAQRNVLVVPAPVPVPAPMPAAAPAPAPAPLPVAAVTVAPEPPLPPAALVAPPAWPVDAMKGGQHAFSAERLPEVRACAPQARAVLAALGPGFESYTVTCADRNALAVRCDFGNCRVLR